MPPFKAIDPNVEVNGQTVLSVVNAMPTMKDILFQILSDNNINNPKPDHWYSQQDWLNSFKQISEKVNPATLYRIGHSIPENAEFPPDIDNIEKALSAINIAYHMNHRLNGMTLFDSQTGRVEEGIGHYHFNKTGDKTAEIICDNPYPCNFDKGIIESMAINFKPYGSYIKVIHDTSLGCRMNGDLRCSYLVSWK